MSTIYRPKVGHFCQEFVQIILATLFVYLCVLLFPIESEQAKLFYFRIYNNSFLKVFSNLYIVASFLAMSYVIFGSSNVYRHYTRATEAVSERRVSTSSCFNHMKRKQKKKWFSMIIVHTHSYSYSFEFLILISGLAFNSRKSL